MSDKTPEKGEEERKLATHLSMKGFEAKLAELERKIILVCYDGSQLSVKALSMTIFDLCSKARKDRLIVCVVGTGEQAQKWKLEAEAEITSQKNHLGLDAGGCTYDCIIKEPMTHGHGHADDALAVARSEKASYMVVGANEGHKKLGSFAERVLKKAPCSVVVAR